MYAPKFLRLPSTLRAYIVSRKNCQILDMLQLKFERVNTSFFVESSLKGCYIEKEIERKRETDKCGRSSVIGSVCKIASRFDSAYIVYTYMYMYV